ncbi:MAG: FHA domain-containing protein [Anaerolineae bacterium]|nr:FHA domain-containing protein [Anaerolineae bacterium]
MSGDRTTPMPQPGWSQRGRNQDDQETMYAHQDSPTPPTLPMESPGPARWEQGAGPAFRPASPPVTPPVPGIGGMPRYQEPAPEGGQTVIMSQRPVPVFAWLVLVDGPDRNAVGTVYPLRADTTTVGRVPGNDIALRDPTCSAQHVRIRAEVQKGQEKEKKTDFVLYDLGSRNGTFAGDRASYKEDASRRYRHVLQDGDYLLIGETTLAFKRL